MARSFNFGSVRWFCPSSTIALILWLCEATIEDPRESFQLQHSRVDSFSCPLDPVTALYPDPSDPTCVRYLLCHRGHSFTRICPVRFAFHPELRWCYPRDLIPENYCQQAVQCQHNGFVEDPKDCTKYYLCFYGQAIHYGCLPKHVFDLVLQKCIKNEEKLKGCL